MYPATLFLLCVHAASVGSGAAREDTCDDGFQCRDGEKCIPKWYLCDGDNDCSDQSDELNATCAESCTGPTAIWCDATGRCQNSENSCLATSHQSSICEDTGFEKACAKYCSETPGLVSCRNESTCVRDSWLCDGDRDCRDGSDEDFATCDRLCAQKSDHVLCRNHRCFSNEEYCLKDTSCLADVPADYCTDICRRNDFFLCNASIASAGRKCVRNGYVCDSDFDCPKGEDESGSECEAKCAAEGNFMCGHGEEMSRCIIAGWVCDGDRDCRDGSDEDDATCDRLCAEKTDHVLCRNHRCVSNEEYCFKNTSCQADVPADFCADVCRGYDFVVCNASSGSAGRKCVPSSYVCDGDFDCPEGEDESGSACEEKCSTEGYFKCGHGEETTRCIIADWACDGDRDCVDGSDEDAATCDRLCAEKSDHVLCTDHRCLPKENYCTRNTSCEADVAADFCADVCRGNDFVLCNASSVSDGWKCVPSNYVCDGDFDCPGGEDESLSACEAQCAAEGNFMCEQGEGGPRCIITNWVCDGEEDCPNGDDENGQTCAAICSDRPGHIFVEEASRCLTLNDACGRGYRNGTVCDEYCEQDGFDYKCKPGHGPSCIKNSWLCDGEPDCPHGEDEDREICEPLCNNEGSSTYCEAEKRCRALLELCKPISVVETGCDTAPCEAFCQLHGFSCPGNVTACIPGEWKCDGDRDCPGGEDEVACGGDVGA